MALSSAINGGSLSNQPFLKNTHQNHIQLQNPKPLRLEILPMVHGLTVQKVHGFPLSINGVLQKYKDAQIESMEGAAFFQACLTEGVAFSQIRAISNFVEARNREEWLIKEAIEQLNMILMGIFKKRLI